MTSTGLPFPSGPQSDTGLPSLLARVNSGGSLLTRSPSLGASAGSWNSMPSSRNRCSSTSILSKARPWHSAAGVTHSPPHPPSPMRPGQRRAPAALPHRAPMLSTAPRARPSQATVATVAGEREESHLPDQRGSAYGCEESSPKQCQAGCRTACRVKRAIAAPNTSSRKPAAVAPSLAACAKRSATATATPRPARGAPEPRRCGAIHRKFASSHVCRSDPQASKAQLC